MRSHGNRTSRRTNQAAPFTGRGVPADCKSAQPISGRGPLLSGEEQMRFLVVFIDGICYNFLEKSGLWR